MKKILYIFLTVYLFSVYSCTDLDFDPPGYISDPFSSVQTGNLYLNALYDGSLPSSGFGANANYTDESDATNDLVRGILSAGSVGDFKIETYERIRYINIGIQACTESSLLQAQKEELLGQMYFLRAYEYYQLTLSYGGVPLILEAQDVEDVDPVTLNRPRNTAKECFEQIIRDLDLAVRYCPASATDAEYGRVTQKAAAAFRGRVYLTFASPLFNPQNSQERWNDAYNACLEAKNICLAAGASLYSVFNNIFLVEGFGQNKEALWTIPYSFEVGKTHGWENSIRPADKTNGRAGRPSAVPTAELTNAFPMKDGKTTDDSSYPYDMQAYWKNRDDRFYATVAYNGVNWNLMGTGKQWSYQGMDNNSQFTQMLNLGAYVRKASNATLSNSPNAGEYTASTGVDWIEIRYAEVLLNLAECANEANKSSEAYAELYTIRARAGVEEGSVASEKYGIRTGLSKEDLREVIMRERFVEFAYENKRYWDMRRRLMYTESLGANTPAFNGTRRNTYVVRPKSPYTAVQIDGLRDNIDVDTDYATYFNTVLTRRDAQSVINFQKKYYFFDIPSNILSRCIEVEQTIGWLDTRAAVEGESAGSPGTFDPLSDQGGTPWRDDL